MANILNLQKYIIVLNKEECLLFQNAEIQKIKVFLNIGVKIERTMIVSPFYRLSKSFEKRLTSVLLISLIIIIVVMRYLDAP